MYFCQAPSGSATWQVRCPDILHAGTSPQPIHGAKLRLPNDIQHKFRIYYLTRQAKALFPRFHTRNMDLGKVPLCACQCRTLCLPFLYLVKDNASRRENQMLSCMEQCSISTRKRHRRDMRQIQKIRTDTRGQQTARHTSSAPTETQKHAPNRYFPPPSLPGFKENKYLRTVLHLLSRRAEGTERKTLHKVKASSMLCLLADRT